MSRCYAALAVTLLLWGTAFPAIRAVLPAFSPPSIVLGRFLTASILLGIYAAAVRLPLPARRDVPALAGIGLMGVAVYHTALNYGMRTVTAGPASMLVNMAPVFTALLAAPILRERIPVAEWLGLAVSLSGAVLIGLGEGKGFHFAPGALLILISAVSWAGSIVAQKPLLRRYSALQVSCWSIWIGTLPMLFFLPELLGDAAHAPLAASVELFYLGALPVAAAYVTWAYVLSRMTASRAASFLYVIPAVATVVAWIWLGEAPPAISLVGGLLALSGVTIVNGAAASSRRQAESSRSSA